MSANEPGAHRPRRHTAGLFDIRVIIGGLLTVYGVVLLVVGWTGTSPSQVTRAGGVNANIWTGIGLVVVGVLLVLWAVLRPIVVDEAELEADKRAVEETARRTVLGEDGD